MSDVITKPGFYKQLNGGKAEVVHVARGRAFGFDPGGNSRAWHDDSGEPVRMYHSEVILSPIVGPWIDPPTVDVGEGWRLLEEGEVIGQSDEVMCKGRCGIRNWSVIHTGCELVGKTVAQGASWWSENFNPVFYRRRVPKPFRISDHGPGVYLTRDGREEPVVGECGFGWTRSFDEGGFQWYGDGHVYSFGVESPQDLVRYLRPLPKSEPKFKVGDRVRWKVDADCADFLKGASATVCDCREDDLLVEIKSGHLIIVTPSNLEPETQPEWTPTSFLKEVEQEANRAVSLHGEFNSLHEAYAVILEEVDELWDEVRKQSAHRVELDVYNELVQIAASCVKAAQLLKHGNPKEML